MSGNQTSAVKKPKYCSATITNNCMLRCKMCEMWKSVKDVRELTVEDWKSVLVQLRSLLDPHAEICFTGGEPLLKTGILGLIRFAAENGFRTGLNTNAYLIDEEMAQAIAESSLWSITISLESLDENTHDFLRGISGSYLKVIKAIEYLNKFCDGLYIGTSTVILDSNLDDIIDLARWVQNNKRLHSIRFQAMMQPLATPEDKDWHKNDRYNSLWPKNVDKACSVLDKLILLKEKGKLGKLSNPISQLKIFQDYFRNPSGLLRVKKCIFSDFVMNINHIGDIYLCPNMQSLGNVKTDDMNKIWYSDRTIQTRDEIRKCGRSCHIVVNCFWE